MGCSSGSGSPSPAPHRDPNHPSPALGVTPSPPSDELPAPQSSGYKQMGITTRDEHWYTRSLWLHQCAPRKPPTGTSILAARTFGVQHRRTLPKCSVLNYFWPRRKKAMSKRFLERDTATLYYRYYLCYRSTVEPQAQPEIPLLQMLHQRGNLTDWQTGVFLIAERRKKNKLSKKGVKKKVQLKARSPIDSQ